MQHTKTSHNTIFYSLHVLYRIHCLWQLKEKKINSLQYQFLNYSHINIKKKANKEIKQTNEIKGDKTELGQNCTEENYYCFGCCCMTGVSVYLHVTTPFLFKS